MSKLIKFAFAKETPGTYQFKELDKNGEIIADIKDSYIGALYIRKSKLPGKKPPQNITIKLIVGE